MGNQEILFIISLEETWFVSMVFIMTSNIGRNNSTSKSGLSKNAAYANPSINLKQKIITQYRLLLRYLSSRGLRFPPSSTHLDIQKKLKTAGSAKNSVDSITNTFEHARYSPHPTKKNDVDTFDKNIFRIITDFRKWYLCWIQMWNDYTKQCCLLGS